MYTFKNTTAGPKGINRKGGGIVYVDAGATSEPLDVEAGELASAKATGWFEVSSRSAADDKKPAERTKAPE